MLRCCPRTDFRAIHETADGAAEAYRGVIPADRWHDPSMSGEELRRETDAGVRFRGWEEDGQLLRR
jgi:hypothetical protein